MLRPSYSDLLEVISEETNDITLGSRYTIVVAAAKRARELIAADKPLILDNEIQVHKPVSIAVNELYAGKIRVQHGEDVSGEEYVEMDMLSQEME